MQCTNPLKQNPPCLLSNKFMSYKIADATCTKITYGTTSVLFVHACNKSIKQHYRLYVQQITFKSFTLQALVYSIYFSTILAVNRLKKSTAS